YPTAGSGVDPGLAPALGELAQDALEYVGRLAAGNEMGVVDDDRRHRMDLALAPECLAFAHLARVLPGVQHLAGAIPVESGGLHCIEQHLVRGGAAPLGEVGGEKRLLQQALLARIARAPVRAPFLVGPVEQAMGVEGVVDPAAAFGAEPEAHLGASLADHLPRGRLLLRRGAVLLRDVLGDVLAFRPHARIELEGLEMDRCIDLVAQPVQGGLERGQADRAPGAGDIGDEVDPDDGFPEDGFHGVPVSLDLAAPGKAMPTRAVMGARHSTIAHRQAAGRTSPPPEPPCPTTSTSSSGTSSRAPPTCATSASP